MLKVSIACAATMFLAACNDKQSSSDDFVAKIAGGEPVTKAEYELLKAQVDDLTDQRVQRTLLDHTTVTLNPNSAGFSLLDTPVGPIALRIDSVAPSANGSRVTLAVGNTTNATLLKPSATIYWGSVDEKGDELKPAGSITQQKLSDKLEAGRWKLVTLPLANTPPAKLGYVRFTAGSIDGMELAKSAEESE